LLEYYRDTTAISFELLILSGGIVVTGKTPTVLVRDKDTGKYFDFASNTFTSTTTSATGVLTSALDGMYRLTWDISGLFSSNSGTRLAFEYHDGTAASIDDVLITDKMRVNVVGGGGAVNIEGIWTPKQKKELLRRIKKLEETLSSFKKDALVSLRRLLSKKTLQKEDLQFITDIKERDLKMYQELLKLLDLKSSTSEKEVFKKLQEYIKREEQAKVELLEKLNTVLEKPVEKEDEEWIQ